MANVDESEIRAVVEWLRDQIGVPFVLVGGSAVLPDVPIATKDVDVLVSAPDMERADAAMQGRRDAHPLDPATGTIRGTEVAIGGSKIAVDFLSASAFGGQRFVDFVRGSGSVSFAGVRRARPSVVFYMRLSLEDWRENIPSILRDIRMGVGEATLDGATRVAERFGTENSIRERVCEVRATLRRVQNAERNVRRD